mmetsp:Transcript_84475/g.149501  ORF Transcript_84475/g.149501 Transcript_84475/m.149501 type:complete len:84 (+) Transcript_84475:235-486(+)
MLQVVQDGKGLLCTKSFPLLCYLPVECGAWRKGTRFVANRAFWSCNALSATMVAQESFTFVENSESNNRKSRPGDPSNQRYWF